jgi:hypothetical protein
MKRLCDDTPFVGWTRLRQYVMDLQDEVIELNMQAKWYETKLEELRSMYEQLQCRLDILTTINDRGTKCEQNYYSDSWPVRQPLPRDV